MAKDFSYICETEFPVRACADFLYTAQNTRPRVAARASTSADTNTEQHAQESARREELISAR